MRKLYFLVPGTKGKFGGGGLWAELNTYNLAAQICEAEIVTYRQQEAEHLFIAEVLKRSDLKTSIFVIGWGFDVPKLVAKLNNYHLIYHAHSSGYGFRLPPNIPIITVSRNTMGYWGQQAANNLIFYLPNQIGDEFRNLNQMRDIDVLVQTRKSSAYLLQQLVPALQTRCRVKLLEGYVEDLAGLFNRSQIYLYDSAEYWVVSGVSEGFGLPPLEALACGCQVFSSVNHGLADYLDPGFNCHKIAGYALEYDLQRIMSVLKSSEKSSLPESFFAEYRREHLSKRLKTILKEINSFFDFQTDNYASISSLTSWRIKQLWFQQLLIKLRKLKKS
ncbi:glycosyltransferase [Myxosarcina sp. GI1]|uniref:glycosyltransferase n=1 Tax=Myxosarcina sp. GI1 TaxID=1541065 RepID=UPI00055B398E|nr:glycosyltransferase [Myxosarcina sp. GI1]